MKTASRAQPRSSPPLVQMRRYTPGVYPFLFPSIISSLPQLPPPPSPQRLQIQQIQQPSSSGSTPSPVGEYDSNRFHRVQKLSKSLERSFEVHAVFFFDSCQGSVSALLCLSNNTLADILLWYCPRTLGGLSLEEQGQCAHSIIYDLHPVASRSHCLLKTHKYLFFIIQRGSCLSITVLINTVAQLTTALQFTLTAQSC